MCTCAAIQKFELASFLRWYVTVELHDPGYTKRFYSIYELFEDMMKVPGKSLHGVLIGSMLLTDFIY